VDVTTGGLYAKETQEAVVTVSFTAGGF